MKKNLTLKKKIILLNNSPEFIGNYDPIKSIILSKNKTIPEPTLENLIYKNISKKLFDLNDKIKKFAMNNSINLLPKRN